MTYNSFVEVLINQVSSNQTKYAHIHAPGKNDSY